MPLLSSAVSRTASGEIKENNGGTVRLQGIAIVAEVSATSERKQGNYLQPRFSLIAGHKAMGAKKHFG